MFERYTDRARRVIILAQDQAREFKHNYIGTEHVLLGLVKEGEGVAAQVLSEAGVDPDAVRAAVEDIVGEGREEPRGHIPFTPRTKKVCELALREALQLGYNYIGTEHLLLAVIREGEGIAAQVLARMLGEEWAWPLRRAVLDKIKDKPHSRTTATTVRAVDPCACGHVRAHHSDAFDLPCAWRGCGCPRFIAGQRVVEVQFT